MTMVTRRVKHRHDINCADGMTRFFILQVTGHKLVRLLPPVENWKAGTTDGHLYQPRLFTADLMHPNFTALPDLDGATVMETVLAPGDVLYIPEGWGHQALNLDFSGCVSTNCAPPCLCPPYREQLVVDLSRYLGRNLQIHRDCPSLVLLQNRP